MALHPFADGSEELYDLAADPHEWHNLAADPAHAATRRELAHWLPEVNRPPMPGCVIRLTEIRDGQVYWEGKPVDPRIHPNRR